MFTAVQDYTLSITPGKKKRSQAGWLSFNAVCCSHNGESPDTRGRGGVITNPEGGISYSCFNCKFKASYQPGRPLSFKYRKLLSWMGADPNEVKRLVIEALRIKDLVQPETLQEPAEEISFEDRSLPTEARSFWALAEFYELNDWKNVPLGYHDAINYIDRRQIDMRRYDFYWTPEVEYKLSHRVVIPFLYKGRTVGYTARAFNDGIRPKYHSNHPADFVFNLDQQHRDNRFVIVTEGAFDAMSIDGVAVLGSEISETQAEQIEALGKEVIVVPDFDRQADDKGQVRWPGKRLLDWAIEYHWCASFPVWQETCKDVNDAVVKYGKLFVLKSILAAKETSGLKITLQANKIK